MWVGGRGLFAIKVDMYSVKIEVKYKERDICMMNCHNAGTTSCMNVPDHRFSSSGIFDAYITRSYYQFTGENW